MLCWSRNLFARRQSEHQSVAYTIIDCSGMLANKPQIEWYIRTIDFGYSDWRGAFYPREMKASGDFAHYSLIFNAVEIDSTFHALPQLEIMLRWVQMVLLNTSYLRRC